jgi:hypothetical protein
MTSIWDGGVIVDNGGTREFVVVCNNEFVQGWLRDQENDDNIGDTRIFTQVQTFQGIIVLRHVFFYYSWQLML